MSRDTNGNSGKLKVEPFGRDIEKIALDVDSALIDSVV
jgi:hypothetical protein